MAAKHPYPSQAVISLCREYLSCHSRVLDVGCADGETGAIIKRLEGCCVWGIDIDGKALQNAKKVLDKVFLADMENTPPKLPKKYFDLIIFSNILEHLRHPINILADCKKYLKGNSLVIVAVPNIAHWQIRLNLLRGRFQYSKWGILAQDHLRFFSRASLLESLENTGYQPLKIQTNFLGWRQKIARLWPTLLASQFVVVARLKNAKAKKSK